MTNTEIIPEAEAAELTGPQELSGPDPALLYDIAAFIKTYVVLPSEQHALILAAWVVHTWTFNSARSTPYLYVHSPDKQCGKTRLIEVLEVLVRNPMRGTHVSYSVLYRAIDTLKPTLMLDECDAIWAGARNEPLRGILNGGYKLGGHVWRVQNQQPKQFDTFSPKLLAGINNGFMPDTIRDRCIPIVLKRKKRGQECDRFYALDEASGPVVTDLLDRIEAFCVEFGKSLSFVRPDAMEGVSDRQSEITEPLMALGMVFGIEEEMRLAVLAMFKDAEEAPSQIKVLLRDIREAFEGSDRILLSNLLRKLGPAWTAKQLAAWLAPLGIAVQPDVRVLTTTADGFLAEQFEDAWTEEA